MVEIGRLDGTRWREFRDLRLEALSSDPLAFSSSPDEERGMPEEEWRRRMENTLFALCGGKAVGMIAIGFNSRKKTRHAASLHGVYVRRENRRQGMGMALVEAALRAIGEKGGVSKVTLGVNPEQRGAVRVYEKCGFVRAGVLSRELKIDGRYHDVLLMEKRLRSRKGAGEERKALWHRLDLAHSAPPGPTSTLKWEKRQLL